MNLLCFCVTGFSYCLTIPSPPLLLNSFAREVEMTLSIIIKENYERKFLYLFNKNILNAYTVLDAGYIRVSKIIYNFLFHGA